MKNYMPWEEKIIQILLPMMGSRIKAKIHRGNLSRFINSCFNGAVSE
jgi:hypothetical protein